MDAGFRASTRLLRYWFIKYRIKKSMGFAVLHPSYKSSGRMGGTQRNPSC
jgi:hypothetical protein